MPGRRNSIPLQLKAKPLPAINNKIMVPQIFDKDDNIYLKWMDSNPLFFVVNTGRRRNSKDFILHKCKCHHISTTTKLEKGAYTENEYVKIGSNDLQELENWFVENRPNFRKTFEECKSCNPFSEKYFDSPLYLFPDTIENDKENLFEGAKKQITVNSYERNYKARQKCLDYHGYSCKVCELNFEEKYGIIGKEFIHVHHLNELHGIGERYIINPETELTPVCPNCHSMLHQRIPCYSIEELKNIMNLTSGNTCLL